MAVQTIRVGNKVYRFEGIMLKEAKVLATQALADPVTQTYEINPRHPFEKPEVGYKPGVTDPTEQSLLRAAQLLSIKPFAVSTSEITNRRPSQIERVIEKEPKTLIFGSNPQKTKKVKVRSLSSNALNKLSQTRSLFLNLDEMKVIQEHYKKLKREPTDLELEVFAQTWSEHCFHKTFKAILVDEKGKTYEPLMARIKNASKKYFKKVGVVSAFSDNAGGMDFYDGQVIIGKGETHNSPVAIDPYGGSLTKNGGVYRDIAGFGKGAVNVTSFMINNFADPNFDNSKLPEGVLEPKNLFLENSRGEREYGNPMGIPTHAINIHFHPNYGPKPTSLGIVLGITPQKYAHKEVPQKGDLIISLGGKTGRDGIHGATFSSGEMTQDTVDIHSTAVQLGDPIVEKAMFDAIRQARDKNLIRSITDCGAGGYSSAIGEMAKNVGAQVNLENIPVKYKGLSPWELFLSESQERMVMAIDPKNLEELERIAKRYDTSLCVIGKFTADNKLTVKYNDEVCGQIDLNFLYNGLPQRKMKMKNHKFPRATDTADDFKTILSNLNICSKEEMHRMYDTTVQAMTVMAPYVGANHNIPSEASVLAPIPNKPYGLISTYALNPMMNLSDPYGGVVWTFAHAAAKFTAAGGDIDQACGIDNYIWPFPDEESLYDLHMATDALVDMINTFGIPMVSGKDSLSSTYRGKNGKLIKVAPTLNITLFGKIPDIKRTITPDIKSTNSIICLVGETGPISPKKLPKNFKAVHKAIKKGKIKSAKAVGEEGVAVALAIMCIGGDCGGKFGLGDFVFTQPIGAILVEVENMQDMKELFGEAGYHYLGKTNASRHFAIKDVLDEDISDLTDFWQKPMAQILDERVKVAVLAAPGINRDLATQKAFELAGARADIVHITELKEDSSILQKYQVLSLPGGFSYGDHIQSGRILALELLNQNVSKQIIKLLDRGGLIIGVCNGFQALMQCGLLPFGKFHSLSQIKATLANNHPNRFQSRWIHLKPNNSVCKFINGTSDILNIPVASGEGRFLTADEQTLQQLQDNNQIVYQYCDAKGQISEEFPINPNDSQMNIAGICDPSGQILGMMPHAEDFVRREHHPNWRRQPDLSVDGLKFFQNIVNVAKQL